MKFFWADFEARLMHRTNGEMHVRKLKPKRWEYVYKFTVHIMLNFFFYSYIASS